MIAPRFSGHRDGSADQQPQSLNINLNVNLPPQATEVLMQLLTRATYSPMSSPEYSETAAAPVVPVDEPAGTKVASSEAKGPPRQKPAEPRAAECGASMEALLKAAPVTLVRKRSRASAKQRTAHGTSARAFDQFLGQLKSAPVLYTGAELLQWMRKDGESATPTIRRAFAVYWLGELGKSPTTVLKYWQHIAMICRAHGVLLEAWQLYELKTLQASLSESPASPVFTRKLPTVEECDAIVRHAAAATGPYGDHSPYFWRGLIRFFCYFGLRTRDLVSVEVGKTGLQKPNIFWDPACPDHDVNAALGYELRNPGGWIMLRIGKAAKSDVPWTLIPIPLWARGWLRFFCEFSHDPVRVFPSRQKGSVSLCQATLSSAWNQILTAADVDKSLRLSEGRGDRIAIRKYSGNWWRLAVAEHTGDSALAKDVACYVLHHAEITRSTANRHYLSVKATVLPTIVELLPKFPKPAADAVPVSLLPE